MSSNTRTQRSMRLCIRPRSRGASRGVVKALYSNDDATLEEKREAMETLEDLEATARRVLGGSHPLTTDIRRDLHKTRERRSAPAKATA